MLKKQKIYTNKKNTVKILLTWKQKFTLILMKPYLQIVPLKKRIK